MKPKKNISFLTIFFFSIFSYSFEMSLRNSLSNISSGSMKTTIYTKINNKFLTNSNDAFVFNNKNDIENQLLQEKEAKKFFYLIMGEKKLKILDGILAPLGEKWKKKLLTLVINV